MSRALFIVDVQNDFTERGALGVQGGDEVAGRISGYLVAHADDYALVVASRDWHHGDDDNGGHFSSTPDFVDTWPVHCVGGTYGADYDEVFDTTRVTHHLKKGQGKPAYSLFEGSPTTARPPRSSSSPTASATSTSSASRPITASARRPWMRWRRAAVCACSPT